MRRFARNATPAYVTGQQSSRVQVLAQLGGLIFVLDLRQDVGQFLQLGVFFAHLAAQKRKSLRTPTRRKEWRSLHRRRRRERPARRRDWGPPRTCRTWRSCARSAAVGTFEFVSFDATLTERALWRFVHFLSFVAKVTNEFNEKYQPQKNDQITLAA